MSPALHRLTLPAHDARVRRAFAVLLGFAALFACYLWAARYLNHTSDNAGIILEAQAMGRGNVLLHGWYLPPDSFLTTEMPLDALLGTLFSGRQLLTITPALLYALTVCGAAYLAALLAPEEADRRVAVGACVALLAFPIAVIFPLVLRGPFHIATIVATLIAWWALDRYTKRSSSRLALGLFTVVTALATLGDPMTELLVAAPVVVVCSWMLWRTRGRDIIARSLLICATVATLIGMLLQRALILSGTHIAPTSARLSSLPQVWRHLQWLWLAVCALFHIDVSQSAGLGQRLVFTLLNGAFLLLGVVGFVRLFRHVLFPNDMRDALRSMLSWAILAGVSAFLISGFATDVEGVRYLLPTFVYAGILCSSALRLVVPARRLGGVVLAFLVAGALTFGVTLARAHRTAAREQPVVAFLLSHHLTTGLGGYWASDITSLSSNGQILVIPVHPDGDHFLLYRWHASAAWFTHRSLQAARFIVVDHNEPVDQFLNAACSEFGSPDAVYHVEQYTILVWSHPLRTPQMFPG